MLLGSTAAAMLPKQARGTYRNNVTNHFYKLPSQTVLSEEKGTLVFNPEEKGAEGPLDGSSALQCPPPHLPSERD